jgi:formate hydrogenlyase subunit 3/multisubunit Na+/H+ antiporter MnhD subunit
MSDPARRSGDPAAATVMACWLAGNAVLVGALPAFGENAFAVTLYATSIALPTVFAAAVWAAPAANPDAALRFAISPGRWVPPAALGVVLIGVGSIFGIWFIIIGAATVLVCLYRLRVESVRRRAPADHGRDDSLVDQGAAGAGDLDEEGADGQQ